MIKKNLYINNNIFFQTYFIWAAYVATTVQNKFECIVNKYIYKDKISNKHKIKNN